MKSKLQTWFKNKRFVRGLIIAVVAILLVSGIFYLEKTQGRVFIDDSLVQAPIINVSPAQSEKLMEIDVYDGQKVTRGDVLGIAGTDTLRADTDGLIIMANQQIGSLISVQNPLAQMINTADMRIAGTIDENKGLDSVRVGQVASFTVDALPGRVFWGYVDEVSPSAKQTQLSFSISSERPTQQFVVYVKYDANKYPEIKNGMSAKITVYTNTN
ncbi:MAG: efflux RND transporter periplasmic adaptor subunit [Patescibacteria group bacterium]|nr:efflux RND transporter periplasmic adaptor subunit [Patescibacteria group bacterium]MDE2588308.1 efflux RND transporter periplasmic adaptor subunit [Patescibacteria group bacterium]